jgi:hypothetical protein
VGRELYEIFVCERNALGAAAAQALIERAESSFAAWPIERDLIFRDVAQYLIISEYLESHPAAIGTSINMARVISGLIPSAL